MYYDFLQRHKQRIIVISSLIGIVFIAWTAIVLTGRIGKLPVVVAVVPNNATITANGQRIGNGTQWLTSGTYKISASKDGFKTIKKSVTVTDNKSQNVIALSLTAESSEAKKWANEHQQEYTNNEQYGAIAANADGKYFADRYPLTTKLPFTDPYFTIGYIVNEKGAATITITTPSPRYRFYAVEQIRKFGYDPTDYTIDFKDFHNPLEQQ